MDKSKKTNSRQQFLEDMNLDLNLEECWPADTVFIIAFHLF